MSEYVIIYGFGSAFRKSIAAQDVDLLIVHPKNDDKSCRFAIRCKKALTERFTIAHVTMLSSSEESRFRFRSTAQAIALGAIHEENFEDDFASLVKIIRERSSLCFQQRVLCLSLTGCK